MVPKKLGNKIKENNEKFKTQTTRSYENVLLIGNLIQS